MSDDRPADLVLIMAPIGADATNIASVLQRVNLVPRVCRVPADLRSALDAECAAIVLTEEALSKESKRVLLEIFAAQPAWSDIPVVLISSAGSTNLGPALAAELRGARRTITLLERPLRSATLLAALETLLAARHRQYEIRHLLHERDALLSSLESRVAERTTELQRMVEEMEAFSYSVSHDLRSPLRSLAGYAEALKEDYAEELPEGARHYCERIVRAARRMDALTQDVLAYTRVSRCEIELTSVDLDSLLTDVVDQYPSLVSSGPDIRIHRPLGWVKGHVPSLIQCFSNLLGNAVKFVPPGRRPEVDINASVHDGRRRVSVRDNGMGIAPADHARIFRMFEQAAGRKLPGTGIGLAIVKKAVERMGGTVGVNSVLGHGAEFWVELASAATPGASAPPATNFAYVSSEEVVGGGPLTVIP